MNGRESTEQNTQTGDLVVEDAESDVKTPSKFAVVLLNDDYTTMEFVVEVLKKFFHKTQDAAMQVMLKVHNEGRGVAGIYSFEIAETKAAQVHEYSRTKGFPLKCEIEPTT